MKDVRRSGYLSPIEILVVLVGVGALFFILVPLLYPTNVRVHTTRAQCANNLRCVGLALLMYEKDYGVFPAACTVDAEGRPLHSWRTLILPYLDEKELYSMIDLSRPWNDPVNARILNLPISVYHCPDSKSPRNMTTYQALVGPSACLAPRRPRRREEILDGPSNTLMVIEAGEDQAVPWMAPYDANEQVVLSFGPQTKRAHSTGRNAVFLDGSTRFLNVDLRPDTLRAFISIDGNEKLDEMDLE